MKKIALPHFYNLLLHFWKSQIRVDVTKIQWNMFFENNHWRNPLYFTAYFFDTHNPSLCNYLMKRNSCYPTNLIIIHHAQKTWWYDKQTRKPNNKTILVTWKTNHNLNSLPCIIVSNPVPLVSIWCAYKTVTFSPKFHIFTFHFQL